MNEEHKFYSGNARENIVTYSNRYDETSNYLVKFLLSASLSLLTAYLALTSYTINAYSKGEYNKNFPVLVDGLGDSFFYIFISFCIGLTLIFCFHFLFNLFISSELKASYKRNDTERMYYPIGNYSRLLFGIRVLLILSGYVCLIIGLYEIYSELSSALDLITKSQNAG